MICLAAAYLALAPLGPATAPKSTAARSASVRQAPRPMWSIEPGRGLVWNGAPYRPFGVRIGADPAAIRALRDRGVTDFLVDLPAAGDWGPTFESLKGAGAIVAINSAVPMAEGYTVLPQSYRVEGITQSVAQTVPLPGAKACFVVVANKRDGQAVWSGPADVQDGLATFTPKLIDGSEHVALLYPLGPSLHTEDLWEGLDLHRDALLTRFRTVDRTSLRAILDPLGATAPTRDRTLDVIPASSMFRAELAEYLQTNYRNLLTALQSWALNANDIDSFETMARLVPLWNGTRGVSLLLDPETQRTYSVQRRSAIVWRDLNNVVSGARERRASRLFAALRREAGVPILKSWEGWSSDVETNRIGYDGLAFVGSTGGVAEAVDTTSRPLSTVLRWNRPAWLLASGFAKRSTPEELGRAGEELAGLGVSAAFVAADDLPAGKPPAFPADSSAPTALYFPENALNPAFPQRLGGAWWLPVPTAGSRIDLGSSFAAYRDDSNGGRFALWSTLGRKRVVLLSNTPKAMRITATDGTDVRAKLVKDGVEVDVPETPLLIDGVTGIPVPKPALDELVEELQGFGRLADAQRRDIGDETYPLGRLNDLIKKDPSNAAVLLGRVNSRLRMRLGTSLWLEGELSPRHTFGEVITDGSASGGQAIALDAAIPADAPNGLTFLVAARTEGDQDVWIALRASEENRKRLSIRVNGQVMLLTSEGVNPYGSGYRWYKAGTTRLSGAQNEVSVQIRPRLHDEIVVDTILITNPGTVPDGVKVPAVPLPPPEKKGKKG